MSVLLVAAIALGFVVAGYATGGATTALMAGMAATLSGPMGAWWGARYRR